MFRLKRFRAANRPVLEVSVGCLHFSLGMYFIQKGHSPPMSLLPTVPPILSLSHWHEHTVQSISRFNCAITLIPLRKDLLIAKLPGDFKGYPGLESIITRARALLRSQQIVHTTVLRNPTLIIRKEPSIFSCHTVTRRMRSVNHSAHHTAPSKKQMLNRQVGVSSSANSERRMSRVHRPRRKERDRS